MYKKIFIISLLFVFLIQTPSIYAQTTNNGEYNSTSDTTINSSQGNDSISKEVSTGGFDWRWLLPILAIPIVLLFLGEKKEDEFTRYYDRPIVGAKGGKSKRKKAKLKK